MIANLSESYDAVYSVKLGNVNEISFSVPYYIDGESDRVENDSIELIKQKMYLRVEYNNKKEWMIIDEVEDIGDGDKKHMLVTAFSNVYENSHKRIRGMEIEVANPEEYYGRILEDSSWTLGEVDSLFKDIYRSFDIGDTTVLDAIITGAETYGAVLDFDSENKEINLMDIERRSKYRGLHINYRNFLQSISRKSTSDEMTTRMHVSGADGIDISRVNPTGMPYLEDFSYFLYPFKRDDEKNVIVSSDYMSDELAHALLDLNELVKKYTPTIKEYQEKIDFKTPELVESEIELNALEFNMNTIRGLLDIAKATNDEQLTNQRREELLVVEAKVVEQRIRVDEVQEEMDSYSRLISNLQESISVTSFSNELMNELNPFIIEKDFKDERYIDEEELYDDAVKEFENAKNPSYSITASIDNIIESLEEEYYGDKVALGDIARIVDSDMRVDMKSLITEMKFNMDEKSHEITISDGDVDIDGYDRILSILYDTKTTTTMLSNSKGKWDAVTEIRSEVDQLRDGNIDATKNRIYAGINESVEIGDRGVILSNPDFPKEMVIMQAGVIALSRDGGENWTTSITPDGVMADTIIGKLVASNNLLITNDSGNFRIDSEGMTVDMDSIKIMSGDGGTPQNLIDSWNSMMITMGEFADDNILNPYEKNQIKKQWDSIVKTHSSMVKTIQDALGPETPENQYPVEYNRYMVSYEKLNDLLNKHIQSDGHTILSPSNMDKSSEIDGAYYYETISDYELRKEEFQTVIPVELSQTYIKQLEDSISLNYVKNGDIISSLEVYEDGVRIDGKFLTINSETQFNDDVVMNAGVLRSKDSGVVIDLNAGTIDLTRPLRIGNKPVATEESVGEMGEDIRSEIIISNELLSSKVEDRITEVSSEITQESDRIKLELRDDINDLGSSIDTTIDGIRSEVQGFDGRISAIDQKADSITSSVDDKLAGVSSEIKQEADKVKLELGDDIAGVSAEITSTAKGIRSEISSVDGRVSTVDQRVDGLTRTVSGKLGQSEFLQLENKIQSKVSGTDFTGSKIASLITQTPSAIDLISENINLSGRVTFSSFDYSTRQSLNSTATTASTAKSTADTAKSTADSASNTANTALSRANTARDSASAVGTIVDGWRVPGKTTIDGAYLETGTVDAEHIKAHGTLEGVYIKGGSIVIEGGSPKVSRFRVDTAGNLTAGRGGFSVPWNADGVYNSFRPSGASRSGARWKVDDSNYMYQDTLGVSFFMGNKDSSVFNFVKNGSSPYISVGGNTVLHSGDITYGSVSGRGEWIRFPDGLQICTSWNAIPTGGFSSWGSIYWKYLSDRTWTFPASFVRAPTIAISSEGGETWFTQREITRFRASDLQAYRPVTGGFGSAQSVRMTAIGRWKL